MIRRSDNFKTLGCDFVLQNHGAEWQFSEGFSTARRLTDEAINGLRRPFQIVISTDRFCPLSDIIDSIILSTEGTGLLQAMHGGKPIIRFHLMLRGEHALDIIQANDSHIRRLENSGVMFTVEECNSSSGISELTNARECALQYIRNLNKDDNPIILWLDDDLAFDALIVRDNQVHLSRPWSFFHEVWRFHESNPEIEIGLGDVTGAPPLPASSTLLTNLTDLESAITGSRSRSDEERWSESDYYYDLSDHSRSSEPWNYEIIDFNCEEILWDLIEVGTLARPLVVSNSSLVIQNGRYVRGGNTIIFNHQLLDKFDHPKIPRRGDSIWALTVQKNGGVLGHFPVPLRHIRDIRNANWSPQNAQQNWLRRLEVDLVGASFQRWYANTDSTVTPEEILVERCERQLRVFNSCLSRLDNLPPEICSVMREYIQSGIGRTTKLRNNPSVFSAYHQCVNSNTIHAPEYNRKESVIV